MIDKLLKLFTRTGRHAHGDAPRDTRSGPSLDALLAQFDDELANFSELVAPAANSMPRTPFDIEVPEDEQWMRKLGAREALRLLPRMPVLMQAMKRSARFYDGRFTPRERNASPEFLAKLEAGARARGASAVKFVEVPDYAIFRDKGLPCRYAIVLTVEMDKARMESAPSFDAFVEVVDGYKRLALISNWIAKQLRRAGFAGYPGTALGGLTDYPLLAELAGLGAIGYHGLLIAPEGGARLRINTVYTNIENLPLASTQAHAWVRDFCAMCRKCVRKCPVDAIFDEPVPRGDGGMQCIDREGCNEYFSRNYGCAICLAVCPFSHSGYDKVQARFKGNERAPRFAIPVRLPIVA